jgi:hypothetical protein
MRTTIVLAKSVFSSCQRCQNETAANKFCVKLKKTAAETFQMLKRHMVRNFYREQLCLNGVKGLTKGSENENAKIVGENNSDCIFFNAKLPLIYAGNTDCID